MRSFGGERRGAGDRSTRSRYRILAVVVAILTTATLTAPAVGQPVPGWPDGEWVGVISGSGAAAGTLDGHTGSGTARASGGFTIDIVDGEASGGYGVVWTGQGVSADDDSVEVLLEEMGSVEGTNGQPLLVRDSFTGTVTVDGFALALPGGSLSPAPTPLIVESLDCGLVEGYFQGKLAALEAGFESYGINASAEERFVAFGSATSGPGFEDELRAAAERLGDLQTGMIQLALIATAENVVETLLEAELIIAEAEEILAGLDGFEGCELAGADGFRLGITHAAEALFSRLFELAADDAAALEHIAMDAVRSGVSTGVALRDTALEAISAAADVAAAAGDKDSLEQLATAALLLGLVDEFQRIVSLYGEIS